MFSCQGSSVLKRADCDVTLGELEKSGCFTPNISDDNETPAKRQTTILTNRELKHLKEQRYTWSDEGGRDRIGGILGRFRPLSSPVVPRLDAKGRINESVQKGVQKREPPDPKIVAPSSPA